MKNSRAIFWLIFLLVLTALAHVFLSYKGGVAAKLVRRTTLAEDQFSSPVKIEIRRTGGAAPRETVLSFDNAWMIVAPYKALADGSAASRLADMLCTAPIEETIAEQELLRLGRDRADFSLDPENALSVTLSTAGASTTVLLGSSTPSGSGVYAAVEGEDAIYVVSSNVLSVADLPVEDFRERLVFPEWPGSVVSFGVKSSQGLFARFSRDGEEWKMVEPASGVANAQRIRDFLEALSSAQSADFIWPTGAKLENPIATVSFLAGYGLDPDSAVTLTLKCTDGVDRQISFGSSAKEGDRVYALVNNPQSVVTLDGALKRMTLAAATRFTDSRLFPLEPHQVTRIELTQSNTDHVISRTTNGLWRLDSPVSAPADQEAVQTLLKRLLSISGDTASVAQKTIDSSPGSISVELSTSHEQSKTVRENLLPSAIGDFRPISLRSREMLDIDPQTMKRVVVSPRDGKPDSIIYDGDRKNWNVEESAARGKVDEPAVALLVGAFHPLTALKVVSLKASADDLAKYGLDKPRWTIAIDSKDESQVRRNVLVGEETSDGVYATIGATDAIFLLEAETARRITASLVKED